MFEHLVDLETELEKLESQLPELYASGDQAAARDAGRRHAELRPVVDAYREYRRTETDVADARELLAAESDPEMRAYLQGELAERETRLAELEATLKELLVPRDPNDGKNVIMEIRGAEGGDEANLWAGDLFEMYRRYAELRGWGLEVLSSQPSEMGGYRDITFVVKGKDAWARLKHEAGPHRVQRVPATESQGRVHTSAATVAVLPEAVTCQDEKSQLQNKDKALRILRSRLLQAERERQAEELSSTRRDQVKSGGRSEKIRTYNFKEKRVTDHRIGLTLHALDQVLADQLDPIVDGLIAAERAEQLASASA